jgi:hypothetical protein
MITGRRIRNVDRHLAHISHGAEIVIALTDPRRHETKLAEIGFERLEPGAAVLPAPQGPISLFNAEGKNLVHKDQPKEVAYRQIEWEWTEWHGPYEVRQSDFRYVPYDRYPRTFVPPPSIELSVAESPSGELIAVTSPIPYVEENRDQLLHRINLFLELFGECQVLTQELVPTVAERIRTLNWTVLPPGRMPWEELQSALEPVVQRIPRGNQSVIEHRLRIIHEHAPDFTAVGRAGFRGYIIFGFEERQTFVLESLYYGNATYILGAEWEQLSRRTKAELLSEDLNEDRIVHDQAWESRIREWLTGTRSPRQQ